ncbi:MAG TPA: metalloregulator ArsR/SmtB family transcription factor [Candidatus Saccharimonadales bacterium]
MSHAKQVNELRELFKKCLPLFNALGDSTRQQLMLLLMNDKQRSVEELTSETALSRPTISHHLKILKDAGLIAEQRQGRKHYYAPCGGVHLEMIEKLITAVRTLERQKGI